MGQGKLGSMKVGRSVVQARQVHGTEGVPLSGGLSWGRMTVWEEEPAVERDTHTQEQAKLHNEATCGWLVSAILS